MSKTIIRTDQAPQAIGTYSQAVRAGSTLYLSGQIPLSPESMELVDGNMEAQIRRVFENLQAVARAAGSRRGRLHPATKTFQALRILVNRELEALRRGLCAGLELLRRGGRMAVISFHSLEDAIVKDFCRRHVGGWESLAAGGRAWRGDRPAMAWVTKKPITPSREEQAANPRSRSAKLRIAERTE